ncbi:Trehalose-6-phosphate hydrolase [Prochlorococcus marinus str. MIT 1313]|nr:Trehalose-6-phosphate hydrolase [Prochlorococcus marinus str. MIT 1313]KZR77314.1 Trehalose-6-phosphate hydrolase [Prochlorococcus marinus str. MIT 1318]
MEAIWLTPLYPSPLQEGGYDITDFKDLHPELGGLAVFHRLLAAAHGLCIKVLLDLVLNHTSNLHRWVQRARRSVLLGVHLGQTTSQEGKLITVWINRSRRSWLSIGESSMDTLWLIGALECNGRELGLQLAALFR